MSLYIKYKLLLLCKIKTVFFLIFKNSKICVQMVYLIRANSNLFFLNDNLKKKKIFWNYNYFFIITLLEWRDIIIINEYVYQVYIFFKSSNKNTISTFFKMSGCGKEDFSTIRPISTGNNNNNNNNNINR